MDYQLIDTFIIKISNLKGLQIHKWIVHGAIFKLKKRRKHCEFCDYSAPQDQNREFKNHVKKCGPNAQMFTCKKAKCNFTVSNKISLTWHEAKCEKDKEESDDPLIVVNIASNLENANEADAMQSREKITANPMKKKQKCDKFDFTSKHIRNLKLHLKRAHGEKIKCSHCDYSGDFNAKMKWKMKKHAEKCGPNVTMYHKFNRNR